VTAAGFERHVITLCGVVACALLLCLSATPALAQDEPGRGARTTKDVSAPVERLWKEYPLNPTPAGDARSSTEPTRSEALQPGSTSARGEEDDGFPTGPVTLVFGGLAIALFGVLALSALTPTPQPTHARQRVALHLPRLRNGRSRKVAQRRRRNLRGSWRSDDDGGETSSAPSKPTSRGSAVGEDMFVPQSLRTRSDPMSNQPEQARPGVPDGREVVADEPVDSDTAANPTRVGEQVMAVLASAQKAADQMLLSAREEADRVRSDAQEQAAASRTEALSETARVQRESARIRLEVETYGKETRDAADVHAAETRAEAERAAERRLAEAEERAQAIVAGAEQRAGDVAQQEVRRQEGAARRQEALAAGVKQHEERLENLLEVFRGMAAQLEDVIRTNQEAKDPEEEQDAEAPADEAIEEVLRPERKAHARPTQ
jgi:hypothetical protein